MATIKRLIIAALQRRRVIGKYFTVRQTLMRARHLITRIKAREVRRKFIITLMEDPPSLSAAKRCRQSISRHGGGDAEYFAAIDEKHSEELLRKHGISWESRGIPRHQAALMGCFASHFLLWLKCLELNEPIMIFECDALCVSALPARPRFRHVINLADGEYRRNDCYHRGLLQFLDTEPFQGSVYYMGIMNSLPSTVAYALSPAGARRLVEAAKKKSACEADLFISKDKVDTIEHHPLPVRLNEDFPSYIDRHTKVT